MLIPFSFTSPGVGGAVFAIGLSRLITRVGLELGVRIYGFIALGLLIPASLTLRQRKEVPAAAFDMFVLLLDGSDERCHVLTTLSPPAQWTQVLPEANELSAPPTRHRTHGFQPLYPTFLPANVRGSERAQCRDGRMACGRWVWLCCFRRTESTLLRILIRASI